MYEHIILFKFNGNGTKDKQEELIRKVKSFKGSIPGIVELTAGINVTEEVENINGYTVGIRVTFQDLQASRDYMHHPLHQELLQSAIPLVDGVVVVDYPID
ncbi:Stress responsive A/B Barrel Domain [Paenibacillus algorifonticola]|uniref:Stress responsive A/B Barrel Domain n=1 Tax=Paenibacillus algorifonticola TaxID=684063 RepID=A0A1I2HTP2_9BACL|nr:Dabb family protein [Paenibacillus algorifonticola]SFF33424.1 Stress responsive A/B Barrel Domain [Paenibacillus algorifonticola]